MSYYPTSYELGFEEAYTQAIVAKEVITVSTYSDLADITDDKKRNDYFYYVTDIDTYYRYDPNTLSFIIVINPASGTILSASNVGSGQGLYKEEVNNDLRFKTLLGTNISITNNTNDLTLSIPQSVATTATPIFNEVQLTTTTPSTNNMATSKLYVDTTISNTINNQKGQPLGLAPLNALGQIDSQYYDPAVLEFKGAWDASTNTPILANGVGNLGDIYIVSTNGTQFSQTFLSGDFIIYDVSNAWKKITGQTAAAVLSVTSGNSSIVIGGTSQNPTISTSQALTTTSNPTFNTITLNGAITNNTDAATKLYVDTAVGTAVQSVSGGTNINTSGTAINPVINLNTTLTGLSSIATNTGTITTTATNPTDIANKTYVDTAVGAINLTPYMQKANNLSDLTNTATARTNLDVFSKGEVTTAIANIAMDDLLNTNLSTIQASNVVGFDGVNYVPTQTTSQLDITNSLLFNADFNSNINDSSTYSATGTATGTIGTVSRAGGNAREAQATNSYISYGYLSHLNFTQTQPFTISFWSRHNITGTIQRNIITQSESDNGSGWSLLLENPSQNRIHFQMADNTSARNIQVRWDGLPNFGDNNWHHIVFTKGDGITIDKFKLYYDGQLREDLKSLISNTLLITDNVQVANTIPFNLFSRNLGEGTEFFIGALDDVRIYNFELKEQQAKTLYTNAENVHTVLNVIDHTHNISDILTLQTQLNTINTNIANTQLSPYFLVQSPASLGNHLSYNGTIAATTQITIGFNPTGTSGVDYRYNYLDATTTKYPLKLQVVDFNNGANRAIYNVNSFVGTSANAYVYGVSFVSQTGTLSNTNGQLHYVSLYHDIPKTATDITNDATGRTYAIGGNVDLALDGADAQLVSLTNNKVSSVSSTSTLITVGGTTTAPTLTANEANFTLNNIGGSLSIAKGGFDINRAQRNILSNINMQVLTFPTSMFLPNSVSLNANESLTINLNTGGPISGTNYLVSLKGAHSQKATHHTTILKELCFGIKLVGVNWTGASIDNARIGFATEQWFGFVENNITSQNSLIGPTWDLTAPSTTPNKGYVSGFFGSNGYINYNGAGNVVSRAGTNTTNSTGQVNDILLTTFDLANNNIITYWYRGGVQISVLFGTLPSGAQIISNFVSSNLVPLLSVGLSGSGYEIQVMSERDLTADGITFANRPNYFY